jgi:hypothetical protein
MPVAHLLRAASSSCRISGKIPFATPAFTKQSPEELRSYDSGAIRAAAAAGRTVVHNRMFEHLPDVF